MAPLDPLYLSVLLLLFTTPVTTAYDSAAMLKLAASLSPTPSGWSTNSASGYCRWHGIKCHGKTNRVTSINLSNKNLSGTLPSEISTLSALKSLSFQNNNLSGTFPSLANLASLKCLNLSSNNFTSISKGCFQGLTNMRKLSINQNINLEPWVIPAEIADFTSLTTFEASSAMIMGSIPDFLGSLPNLRNLRLSYNNLTGGLPSSFANSYIQNLWLNDQDMGLSGSIDVLSSMSRLKQVWLQRNQFTGPIPNLSNCESLFDLQLKDNVFTGIVPDSLISLPALVNISLSNNKLQGPVPQFKTGVRVDSDGLNSFCVATLGVDCNPQVMTLLEVAGGFGFPVKLADSWPGNDACTWTFVNCNSEKQVISVNLGKQNFGGIISPAFANLTALKSLYLNDDNLTGSIPDSLVGLSQLTVLDVSNNNLTGKVPTFPSTIKLLMAGNPLLEKEISSGAGTSVEDCNTDESSCSSRGVGKGESKVSPGVIAGITIAVVVFVVILLFVMFRHTVKRKHAKTIGNVNNLENRNALVKNETSDCSNVYGVRELFSQDQNIGISIEVLRQMTNNFSEDNILGKGSFGIIYKGELHDGKKIAVKRMKAIAMGTQGLKEFQAEISVLKKVRHRHLVAFLGYCINRHERLLVYEYMSQGTLAQHLFEWLELGYPPITWKQRVIIALDVARGMQYLHSLTQQSFIHRDLKTSNILLGENMRAKVANFGLVKNASDGNQSLETKVVGTFGYLAPEYAALGRLTTKIDVYAFGVVLMEIITGRKSVDNRMPDGRSHLVSWFRRILKKKESISKVIDETLNTDEETLMSICEVAELAGHCAARKPHQRPDMGHAVNVLGPLVQHWKPTNQEDEEDFGFDLDMSQFLQRWTVQEEENSRIDLHMSQFLLRWTV